ncbi:acyl-CoA thioesterase II [Gammaproteobacteria bacterium]|nr:acyl-CoA thioesterase II [Gammaproteobacteria bacterium]MDB3976216.1 acyl-CoA thioesterase II [Gammaproteobacteria bacterium]MDB4815997.1 acyl-CoA thioesterase II [Gammaproteobacteria bacterium]MDC0508909.1 acyl-CoA thioesterase II [Gammaproteobacteria bacterium]MDC0546152.1 acyl-CoA thioesterase II [Gammaproteobacteria bacterium]
MKKKALNKLIKLLDLETLEENLFRGQSENIGGPRVFGGQVIGQALTAAVRTVPEKRFVHSLHAYFLRPGDMEYPIIYDVERTRDGGSFTTRRVVAIQKGEPIFDMALSFHKIEKGPSHQIDMLDIPGPNECTSELEVRKKMIDKVPAKYRDFFLRERPIEIRNLPGEGMFEEPTKKEPYKHVWMKAVGKLPDDVVHHQAILAYASDMGLLSTSMNPHKLSFAKGNVMSASLDHAMWFHRPFRADEWMLYSTDSPSASNARGFNRGSVYTEDGTLVASAVQEGLMRVVKK